MNETYKDALEIYKTLREILGDKEDWLHYGQLFRSASSIVANTAEGEGGERGKKGKSAYSWGIARGELFETIAWVDIALIDNVMPPEKAEELKGKLEKLGDTLKKLFETIDKTQFPSELDPEERTRKSIEKILSYGRGE